MFKVGDYIIGNDKNAYGLTNDRSVCKVVSVGDRKVLVDVVYFLKGHHRFWRRVPRSSFSVEPKYFKLYGVPDNKLSRVMYPDYIEKDGILFPKTIVGKL